MVPFYGQGMNAGLEDVRVLFETLDAHPPSAYPSPIAARAAALDAYSAQRTPDAAAINDLALRNYKEMSHDVVSPLYQARKWVEETLSAWMPGLGWATQYSRVSFGNMRYSEVERATERQGRVLGMVGSGMLAGTSLLAYTLLMVPRGERGRGLLRVGLGAVVCIMPVRMLQALGVGNPVVPYLLYRGLFLGQ